MENLVKGLKTESIILNKLANDVKFAEAVNQYAAKVVDIKTADYAAKHGEVTAELAAKWLEYAIADITFKAFEVSYNYLLDTDEITVIRTSYQNGNIELNAVVTRGGEAIDFNTEMILAGGYNIQALHTRYIVKSKIAKSGNNVKEIVKKYNRIDRLESDLAHEMRVQAQYEQAIKNIDAGEYDCMSKKYYVADLKKIAKRIEKYSAELEALKA